MNSQTGVCTPAGGIVTGKEGSSSSLPVQASFNAGLALRAMVDWTALNHTYSNLII